LFLLPTVSSIKSVLASVDTGIEFAAHILRLE